MRIALTGNPNSGKTTMYNALTGQSEKVGNWAGVTVDKKEHAIKRSFCGKAEELIAVDLPGAYSMSPFTSEESITSTYVKNEAPDVIINIVDATNLSRSLFFTTQLLELGIPTVVALNKTDVNKKKQTEIDIEALSRKLGCTVIETVSVSSEGLCEVISAALGAAGRVQIPPYSDKAGYATDKKSADEADRRRFDFVNRIVKDVERRRVLTRGKNSQDRVDAVLTNKWVGLPIFALVMFFVFQISQAWLGAWLAEGLDIGDTHIWGFVDVIDWFKGVVEGWMSGASIILRAIVLEGILAGLSAVVGFLPLVMVMYFLIALLEDCGYMARATVVLDPIFKKVGLSGKSVIPFVVGTGCAVPGVMACRAIRGERERRATAMLAPFMPCGAKLPVISLFVGAFFPRHGWVGTLMYFGGIFIILVCAWLINSITGNRGKRSFFIIELPEYKFPSLFNAWKSMCQRGADYLVKAGTIILVCNFAVYMMQSFTWSFTIAEDPADSMLASIATPLGYVLAPLIGVVAWQFAAAAVTGFIAKECVVGTLATCFAFEALLDDELIGIAEGVNATSAAGAMGISAAAGLAFLMFNLFSPPCFAAIGAMNAEMKSKRWLAAGVGLQLAVGYTAGFLTFFVGTLVSGAEFAAPWMPILGWSIVLINVAVVAVLIMKNHLKNSNVKG